MDLVDEQHVTFFEVRQQRGEVAGLGDHRARGGTEVDAKLARDDLRQRGLAEAGRTDEQHVVERFLARACRLDEHREVGARLLLAYEVRKLLRAKRRFRDVLLAALGGDDTAGRRAHRTISWLRWRIGHSSRLAIAQQPRLAPKCTAIAKPTNSHSSE